MKKLLTIILFLFCFNSFSQELVFQQVFIKAHDVEAYDAFLKNHFSKIHQKRVDEGGLFAWDAWKVVDTPQEDFTHMVTYIYDFTKEPAEWNAMEALGMNETQMSSVMKNVQSIRERVGKATLNDLASVRKKGAEDVPNIMVLNFMKVKNDLFASYEKSEIEGTKKISNDDLRVGWNFHRRLDNYGTDTYFSHITIDWFDNFRDYIRSNMGSLSDGNDSEWNKLRDLKKRVVLRNFLKIRSK